VIPRQRARGASRRPPTRYRAAPPSAARGSGAARLFDPRPAAGV